MFKERLMIDQRNASETLRLHFLLSNWQRYKSLTGVSVGEGLWKGKLSHAGGRIVTLH